MNPGANLFVGEEISSTRAAKSMWCTCSVVDLVLLMCPKSDGGCTVCTEFFTSLDSFYRIACSLRGFHFSGLAVCCCCGLFLWRCCHVLSALWLGSVRRFLERFPSSGAALAFCVEFWTLAVPCYRVWGSLVPACLLDFPASAAVTGRAATSNSYRPVMPDSSDGWFWGCLVARFGSCCLLVVCRSSFSVMPGGASCVDAQHSMAPHSTVYSIFLCRLLPPLQAQPPRLAMIRTTASTIVQVLVSTGWCRCHRSPMGAWGSRRASSSTS